MIRASVLDDAGQQAGSACLPDVPAGDRRGPRLAAGHEWGNRLWPAVPRAGVVRILALSAGIGLGLALMSGALLFATRASEYSAIWAFQIKMLFVFIGAGSALFAHGHYGWVLERAPDRALRRIAIVSCICWTGALVSGRLIAFVTG